MDFISPLESRPPVVLRTITEFLREISMIGNVSEKVERIDDRVRRLEDEMRKIDAFKRELPLCMVLLNDVIIVLKEESKKCRKSLVEPVFEEFLPLKKSSGDDDLDRHYKVDTNKEDSKEKINWSAEGEGNSSVANDFPVSFKRRNINKAFVPFKGCSGFPVKVVRKDHQEELAGEPGLSLSTPGITNRREDMVIGDFSSKPSRVVPSSASSTVTNIKARAQPQQQTSRKQRRCWSPELHKRFINALQQLGGPQVATPKQIRELMQVEGLTNDEVKSHLQKYRLHTRRIPTTQSSPANKSIVVLGNLFTVDQYGESSKQSSSQSGSPQGTLQLAASSRGTSMTGSDSMEEDGDDRSE
ncbi:PREDICTED: myb family transcription factor EFM-like isoform X2 [Ipomoea nil]|uniref:myb family transcription factor EFM-like isoform X2 n=1 Tax=Ipomoea nil TaxID=35883 RepID=UPI00090098FD|nr:PREDICTED: myb family transcription factor EFM-like isoform X2 [Ipomoea nil]